MNEGEFLLYREVEKNKGSNVIWRFEPGMPLGMPDLGGIISKTNPIHQKSINFPYREGHSWFWIEAKWEVPNTRPEQAIMLRSMWKAGGGVFIFARWKGVRYLVPGGSIDLDTTIRYDDHLARWEDEVDWDEFWQIVGTANYA